MRDVDDDDGDDEKLHCKRFSGMAQKVNFCVGIKRTTTKESSCVAFNIGKGHGIIVNNQKIKRVAEKLLSF